MKKENQNKKKKVGRPATGTDPLLTGRVSQELREEFMAWARNNNLNNSQALRTLIRFALDNLKKE